MKKIISFFMIFAMCITGIASFGIFSSAADQSGIVNADVLNVRSGAGTGYSIVAVIYEGTRVTITGSANDSSGSKWYKINFTYSGSTKTGYVSAAYITVTGSASGGGSAATPSSDQNFEAYMNAQGFPESYKPMLRTLHKQHPKWIFKAQKLGVNWYTALNEECVVGRNLVHYYAPDSWKSMEKGAYDFNGGYWYGLDGSWVAASREIIAYYMDPRNFLDDTSIFMFENLSYNSSVHNINGVKAILADTFMKGNYKTPDTNKTYSYAQTFMTAAQKSGVSPYHLAARCRNEQGVNGAPQSLGTVPGYKNYFNFFDVQAYATSTMTAAEMGCRYAKTTNPEYYLPWTNQYKSIVGGSIFLGKGYITKQQDTLYLQKFDMLDGGNGLYYHQYMTCVFGQETEAQSLKKAYNSDVLNSAMEFKIPVYNNMPNSIYKKPTSYGNNNNFLKSLSVSGHSLNRSFDKYVMSYSLTVEGSVSSISVNASALSGGAKVSGAGRHNLVEGKNTINIKVTAPSGVVRTYTITVTRKKNDSPPAAVTGFKADTNVNSIKLTWNKINDANGYIVYKFDPSKKNYVRLVKTTANINSYTVNKLEQGTNYIFAVKAYKTIDGKEVSSPSFPSLRATTNIPLVTNFKASADITTIGLKWNKVNGADGYVLYRYVPKTNSYSRITTISNVNTTSYNLSKLQQGTEYNYAIKAYKKLSSGEVSSKKCTIVNSGTKFEMVTGLKADADVNTVKLTWTKNKNAEGYVIYRYNPANKSYSWIARVKTNTNTYTVGNLTQGTDYSFAVKPYKNMTYGECSSKACTIVSAGTRFPLVTNFKSTPDAESIKLTWDRVSGAQGYVLYRFDTAKKTYNKIERIVGNVNSYTVNNLSPATHYTFVIKAYKDLKAGEVSSTHCTSVWTNTMCHTVTGFKAQATANSVNLTWNKLEGVNGYVVYKFDPAKRNYVRIAKTSANAVSYKAANLNPNTKYIFAIRAYKTVNGKEILSVSFPSVSSETSLPKVANFSGTSTANSVKLTWDKVGCANGYIVYIYDSAKKNYVRAAKTSTNVNTYTVSGLSAKKTYIFAVKAYQTVNGKEISSSAFPSIRVQTK